ncbi:hypothetical protein [Acinetobacter variabilis]|uniref:hypothetical protein n=2 Tax=Acinetobacter variabilis TaxID=70346 RepID=UPI00289DEB5C|nr:hypothetical protein [Acinetobacter variabilis]
MKPEEIDVFFEQQKQIHEQKKQQRYRLGQHILFVFMLIYTLATGYLAVLNFLDSSDLISGFSIMMLIGVFYMLKYFFTGHLDMRKNI